MYFNLSQSDPGAETLPELELYATDAIGDSRHRADPLSARSNILTPADNIIRISLNSLLWSTHMRYIGRGIKTI